MADEKQGGGSATQERTDPLKDQKDSKGNLIDPPVLPEFEQRLNDAHLRADSDDIAEVQKEYDKARVKRATALAKRGDSS